ncbi:MAG: beta-ketoacyl-[acyl-carrier-protein] synthase family protein [Candidatus Omnitrophica bacterium]|nr:beta-ketoacyl-[acyl-carrier-protein] synthase family protein [Candidatus Omnitrophota bacterium]
MNAKRVAITGIGVLASNAIGKNAFYEALFKGVSGIKPVSLFDTAALKAHLAGEISGFNPQDYLGQKGLRTLDRSTRLVCSATKLCLDDASLAVTQENCGRIGVAVGTSLGSISSISGFDREAILEGPGYVNPALFPNTVINSAASQVSIKFNIQGFNVSVSNSFCSSLDALIYAAQAIRSGRIDACLAGGVEELCLQTYLAFYKGGLLAGLKEGAPELSCPFDKRRNGVILGEGAAVLCLEELTHARKRNARIFAEVLGSGRGFDPYRLNKYYTRADGLKKAVSAALEDSGMPAGDISYISCAANSTWAADLEETRAIKEVFGAKAKMTPASSVKSMLGECFSASAALQAVSAVGAIERQTVPATVNYRESDADCDLDCVPNTARETQVKNVLVNAVSLSGCSTSLVIADFGGQKDKNAA